MRRQASKEYHQEYQAKQRAAARDIADMMFEAYAKINWRRRNKCCKDAELFCRTYFPDIFFNPFVENQKAIVTGITDRIDIGGYQAICAERGGGKSTITKVVAGIYSIVSGRVKFLVLIGASTDFAVNILSDIKDMYEHSDLLAEDFPEFCVPIRAIEGIPQRANGQICDGVSTRLTWKEKEIVLPTVQINGKPTAAEGQVILIRGIDASIRGIVRAQRRPDLVVCDDLETEESANSLEQTRKRKSILQKDVLGLAPPNKRLAVLVLGTIIRRGCLIDQLTDRKIHPEWNGIRQRRIIQYPDKMDLWEKYIELRKIDQRKGDDTGRTAHQFYLDNFEAMNTGAIVSNENRLYRKKLKDKTYYEETALQACFNAIADMGLENFNTEFQNEPPDEAGQTDKLEYFTVMEKCSGVDRYSIPDEAGTVTAFIDVHSDRLFWCVTAWKKNFVGYVIDYGAEKFDVPVRGTIDENIRTKQIVLSIQDALRELTERIAKSINREPDIGHIDAGYLPEAVYSFVKSKPGGIWRASMGGSNRGGNYRQPTKSKTVRHVGFGYHESFQFVSKVWLTIFDTEHFKRTVQEGFRLDDGPGSIRLYGSESTIHKPFAEHIAAEYYDPESRKFIQTYKENHWLDCLTGCALGASRLGIRLPGVTFGRKSIERKRVKLSEKQRRHR